MRTPQQIADELYAHVSPEKRSYAASVGRYAARCGVEERDREIAQEFEDLVKYCDIAHKDNLRSQVDTYRAVLNKLIKELRRE